MRKSYRISMLVAVCALSHPLVVQADNLFFSPLSSVHTSPPSGSPGGGAGNIRINAAKDSVAFMVNYAGLIGNCTSIDVRVISGGVFGPIAVHLSNGGGTSNSVSGQVAWPDSMKVHSDRCFNDFGLELLTDAYPSGEINGPFVCTPSAVRPRTWGAIRTTYR
jgi:hypothetical protein